MPDKSSQPELNSVLYVKLRHVEAKCRSIHAMHTCVKQNFIQTLKVTKDVCRKMCQQLKALAALLEDQSFIPNTHSEQLTTACNSSSREFNTFFWLRQTLLHTNIRLFQQYIGNFELKVILNTVGEKKILKSRR